MCGLYSANDVTMENLQADCKAFESSTTCENKEIRLEKLKIKTMKVSAFKKEKLIFLKGTVGVNIKESDRRGWLVELRVQYNRVKYWNSFNTNKTFYVV